jgi:phospholipid-binding lipoprotein MlaA
MSSVWFRRLYSVSAVALLAISLSACAATKPALVADDEENDPYQGVNRAVFSVNNALDKNVLRPVTDAYKFAIPEPLRDRLRDFLAYASTPGILANELLQGEFGRAGYTFTRFFINTIGGVGIIDLAAEVGMPANEEDFGQTLAVMGVETGPYLMAPLLGPTNPRDIAGFVVDMFINPMTWVSGPAASTAGYARTGAEIIDGRSRTYEFTDQIEAGSVDYYATLRSLSRQRRNDLILNGQPNPNRKFPGITSNLLGDEGTPTDTADASKN